MTNYQYYYLNKQREKYKVQLRKVRNKNRRGGKKALLDNATMMAHEAGHSSLPSPPRTRSGHKKIEGTYSNISHSYDY